VRNQPKLGSIVLLLLSLSGTALGAETRLSSPAHVPAKPKLPLQFTGNLRSYYFTREYGNPGLDTQSAFSLGGKLSFLTNPFWNGFRIGGTVYTAQSLGLNSDYYLRQDRTLPGSPVTVLGQAFGQYENPYVFVRVGNQLITTSWLNDADSRMIPATYQGLYLAVTPVTGLDLIGFRQISFKGRPADHFTKTNLYNPLNVGSGAVTALGNKTDIGTLAFGIKYIRDDLHMHAWIYHFYNYANLAYADMRYKLATAAKVNPLFAWQLAHEWNDGSEILNSVGMGTTRADVVGALLGVEAANWGVTLAGNILPKYHGAYRNGDVVSPYTTGYISDPLFTTSMTAGLIEKAAGSAVKLTAHYDFFNETLLCSASYAKYYTAPYLHNTDETDLDVTFKPQGIFKNLSIRDRIGFLNGNLSYGHFIYNRVMLEYDFLG
jgi:hypothetical protein